MPDVFYASLLFQFLLGTMYFARAHHSWSVLSDIAATDSFDDRTETTWPRHIGNRGKCASFLIPHISKLDIPAMPDCSTKRLASGEAWPLPCLTLTAYQARNTHTIRRNLTSSVRERQLLQRLRRIPPQPLVANVGQPRLIMSMHALVPKLPNLRCAWMPCLRRCHHTARPLTQFLQKHCVIVHTDLLWMQIACHLWIH